MSSLFGQVWFWSLLAFLVGALMTSVLLVRPLSKRVKDLEEQPHEPRLVADDAEWEKADAEIQSWSAQDQDTTTIDKPVADYHDDPDWLESDSLHSGKTEHLDTDRTEHIDAGAATEPDHAEKPSTDDPDEFFRRDDEHDAKLEEELRGDFTADDFASPSGTDDDVATKPGDNADDDDHSGSGLGAAAAGVGVVGAGAAGAAALAGSSKDDDDDKSTAADEKEADGKDADTKEADAKDRSPSASVDAATEINPAAGSLPQRRKRGAGKILGGFGTPKPIKPSLRKTIRRDKAEEPANGADLFDAKDDEHSDNGQSEAAEHYAEPERDTATADESVPAGPFGSGSAMPLPGGEAPNSSFKVKGSVTALRYCTDESSQFDRMVAEVWFASVEDAERVGFRAL